jgi:cytochrome c oxidase subunit 1
MAAGAVVFVLNALTSLRHGALAGDNPWQAPTLEWATSSPPPPYNFAYVPTVAGPDALWDAVPGQPVVVGLRSDVRDVLVTRVMDAEPDHRVVFPDNSIWPLLAAVATTVMFVGSIFTPWAVVWGGVPVFATLVGWFWPKPGEKERHLRGEDPAWEPPVEAA